MENSFEKIKISKQEEKKDLIENPQSFNKLEIRDEEEILKNFTPEEREEIKYKQEILSSLAYFIGKDFRIPVELNEPGAGWHWDFKNNIIRIDPKDLLEKPMDYLRFVISHEGGHRRISRTEFIPLETWNQPGFSFMMNAIEDPRDNNFVAENYPKFREQMELAYKMNLDLEQKIKEKAKEKLGFQPRFMQAGFELIKQWFKETMKEESEISKDLPEEVKTAIEKVLKSAQDSWWRYPSKEEADKSEEIIKEFAKVSYEINLEEIWPEFKKLVEQDMEDEKMQEFLKDMQQQKGESKEKKGGGQGIPQEMKDKLTPKEQKELEKAIKKALKEAERKRKEKGGKKEGEEQEKEQKDESEGTPIDIDSLSEDLKKKIKEYIDSLPESERKELKEKAEKSIKDFEKETSKEIEGKLADNPEKKEQRKETEPEKEKSEKKEKPEEKEADREDITKEEEAKKEEFRKKMEEALKTKEDSYSGALKEVAPLIDNLTGDLRDIFIKRKLGKYQPGYHYGRKWNISKRIQERISGIPLIRTEAREQKESKSEEKDYAITLLIDLSGSMRGEKIKEAFKSVVVLAETLKNLNIKFEILGFQDILLEFKSFDKDLDDEMREKLNQLILEVNDENPGGHNNCGDNNDGECLLAASENLARQNSYNKFLIVLSDGVPCMDSGRKNRSQLDQELKEGVKKITQNTNQKLIGIGLLSDAVKKYYENNIPNVRVEEMTQTLGGTIREIIANN